MNTSHWLKFRAGKEANWKKLFAYQQAVSEKNFRTQCREFANLISIATVFMKFDTFLPLATKLKGAI